MARKKGSTNKGSKVVPVKTLTQEEVVALVRESGIPVATIEKGIGMPLTTLDKCLKGDTVNGWKRTLPAKYEQPLINFIKQKKAEKEELLISTKEVFQDLNIPIVEEEVFIPDEERKRAWVDKLLEAKNMYQ